MCTCIGSGIQGIILPPKLKKRGRPKGAEKTVIGLPTKKRKVKSVIPFLKKLPVEKEKGIVDYLKNTICVTEMLMIFSYTTLVC